MITVGVAHVVPVNYCPLEKGHLEGQIVEGQDRPLNEFGLNVCDFLHGFNGFFPHQGEVSGNRGYFYSYKADG